MPRDIPIIGGFVPFTTLDYPGCVSMVLFLQGCPWRCAYCSNPHLFGMRKATEKDIENWESILNRLRRRIKLVDAVVFSGGEAVAQADGVLAAIKEIHEISPHYKIGLHTNGCMPREVARLLPMIDWVGLDIKAPADKYDSITGVSNSAGPAFETLDLLLKDGVSFECRTTCDPRFLTKKDILGLADFLSKKGVENYAIQKFRPSDKDKNDVSSMDITQFFADKDFELSLRKKFMNLTLRW
ncbi:MAG: anaerobic ribonucleoside-triphosphate reductase activating protein [Rickettsiales bacterium]|jgi:anaerobic ribonucleoside-triphosphate reductase activating protein|nr:anaerobic ribonucleoside-triphosphate reductase activating protein [Rickettsiales bacterium]